MKSPTPPESPDVLGGKLWRELTSRPKDAHLVEPLLAHGEHDSFSRDLILFYICVIFVAVGFCDTPFDSPLQAYASEEEGAPLLSL